MLLGEYGNFSDLMGSVLGQVQTDKVLVIADTYKFLCSCNLGQISDYLVHTQAHCFSLSLVKIQLIIHPLLVL